MKKYKNVTAFIVDLINYEGLVFYDNYGRRWKYSNYKFYFQDIAESIWEQKTGCLHLFGTGIGREKTYEQIKINNN